LVNSLYNYPMYMRFFSTSERLEIGGVPFMSINPKPGRQEALEYYFRVVQKFHLNIHLFEGVKEVKNFSSGDEQHFEIVTSKSTYATKNIIVASGFYDIPILLNVPGEELPKVSHYYKDPSYYSFQKVLVVGASNSAVDAALETWRKGAEVTMVVRGQDIGARVKYWVRPDIINRIHEGSIKAYYNSTIAAIREHEVDIQTPDGIVTLGNDWVIALTGYMPDLGFLKQLDIKLSPDEVMKPEYNEETHESNVKNIYLAGVICGGMNTHRLFIENSREHAVRIIQKIKSERG